MNIFQLSLYAIKLMVEFTCGGIAEFKLTHYWKANAMRCHQWHLTL